MIEYIKTKPFGTSDKVTLTCNMDNIHALNLYKNKGFKETGTMDEDEIELSLMLQQVQFKAISGKLLNYKQDLLWQFGRKEKFMIEYSKLQTGCMLIVIYIAFIYFRERYAYNVNGICNSR